MGLIQKTVYIREEDLDAWNNVSNKAAFLHDALNPGQFVAGPLDDFQKDEIRHKAIYERPAFNEVRETKVVTTTSPKMFPDIVDKLVVKSCKHGADPKFCRFAKNGKACKW